MKKIYCWN